MNISIPETLKSFVDSRVTSGGFGSHSEYIRALVRKDEQEAAKDEQEAAKDALRTLIADGLRSPEARPWAQLRDELAARSVGTAR